MPPKKNEALIEKFKRANEMRRTYGFASTNIPNMRDKIKDACRKLLDPFEQTIKMIQDTLVHIDDRLKYIEGLLFEEENSEENSEEKKTR